MRFPRSWHLLSKRARQRRSRKQGKSSREIRPHLEHLEDRLVLAAINWTGAADATSWQTPGNWDLIRVPAGGDDVIIPDVPGTSSVSYSTGSTSIRSITSS